MKLIHSFLKDLRLATRGFYFYLEIGFSLIFVAVMIFVVPEKFEPKMTVYASIDLSEQYLGAVEESLAQEGYAFTLLESREEVESELAGNRSSVGLVVTMDGGKIVYDYILQGYEGEQLRNILQTSIEAGFAQKSPGYRETTTIETLDAGAEKLPTRLNILPVFLALNAAFMGLFIIASYIFLDKEEGTIQAFAVTPARVWQYLLSKMGVMVVAGLMSGLIATVFIAGGKAHYFHLIVLLIALNAFGSSLGLFIASFFNTMTKAMGWLYMSVIVLSFAAVSYYLPAFSPLVIRLLPSYPMLFAFRETLLDAINLRYVYATILGFSGAGALLFIITNWRFKKTLTL